LTGSTPGPSCEREIGKHRDLIIDTRRQRAACTWSASAGERSVGGIDVFQFDAGRVDRAWSLTGQRQFSF
jgi:hypothetical protein